MRQAKQQRSSEDDFWSLKNPIIYGILGTAALLVIYAVLAWSRSCQEDVCQTNFQHFLASPPNEIGDTLAGIAGILAFLWIIVTVFLQSKELRIARQEYEKMANAQTGQLDLLEKQGKIFEDELQRRNFDANRRYIDTLLLSLLTYLSTPNFSRGTVKFQAQPDAEGMVHRTEGWQIVSSLDFPLKELESLREFGSRMEASQFSLQQIIEHQSIIRAPEKYEETLKESILAAEKVLQTVEQADSIEMERVGRLKVDQILSCLKTVKQALGAKR